ncbi:MAG: hypothetical protein EOP50_09815 [Sphingobacteriales bacterium]|nr:MAG: hypothetical protein EOP50_09815 [Sphingobacteriales bacterium]
MKNDETFRGLPCIVFTTSSSPLDKLFCQKMGVEMFTKPVNVVRLREFSQTILNYCGSND